jgi:AraC-like DNA-binding protein
MVYLLSGRGILETLNRCWDIETGNLFLLFPGVRHAYRPDPKTGWTETWVGFRGPHADRLLTQGIISPKDPVHRPGYHSQLVEGFESILDLARVQAPLHQFRIGARILSILAETLSLERMSAQQSRAKEIVEAAKAFLESRIQLAFDLNGLCDQLSLSPAFLTNVFKDYTGMTPYQFCLHAKINRAKVILSGGECSVKEIAWKVGFEDQFYFSRLFKKKTGYSPTQWMALQAGVS